MDLAYGNVLAIAAILISLWSLRISKERLKIEHTKFEYDKNKNYEEFILKKSEPYINSYMSEHKKIKKYTSELSQLLSRKVITFGRLFNNYGDRYAVKENNNELAHVYDALCCMIRDSYGDSLSWNTAENTYWKLGYLRNANIDFIKQDIQKSSYSDEVIKKFAILFNSVPNEKKPQLYMHFLKEIEELESFFENIRPLVIESINKIEEQFEKNKVEHFNLEENYQLNRLYKQLYNFLKLIDQSYINSFSKYHNEAFSPIGTMVYIGSNIYMLNYLLSRVSNSSWE